ncbi:MAG: hypothetical protein F6J93_22420 [Oscillatoria sp. SIO1A7]|nr:hypothetical protein [Oscillatoria sp. SIO1A7]
MSRCSGCFFELNSLELIDCYGSSDRSRGEEWEGVGRSGREGERVGKRGKEWEGLNKVLFLSPLSPLSPLVSPCLPCLSLS